MNFGEKDNYANFHFETLSFKKKKTDLDNYKIGSKQFW